jgi:peptide/nickel transport system permease protein
MTVRHVASKVAFAALTLVFVLVFNFFLFRVAGDPKKDLIRVPHQSERQREQLIHDRGLDRSLLVQFRIYVVNTLEGQLETSYETRRPVSHEIAAALPNTLLLVLPATLIAALLGTWLGVVAADRRGSRTDGAIMTSSLALWAAPEFAIGIVLVLLLAIKVHAFPVALKSDPGANESGLTYWLDVMQHDALPVITLALSLLAQWVLIMRSSLSEVLQEDYIVTARAIGLTRARLLRRHAVPNALLPVIALTAINLGFVVSGAIVIETLFSWPGIGDLTYSAINNRDTPMLQGIFLVTSAAVIGANLLADLTLSFLDPRVRAA